MSRRGAPASSLLLAVSLLTGTAAEARETTPSAPYLVVAKQGNVAVWPRLGQGWGRVAVGDILPAKSLVRLAPRALLRVRPAGRQTARQQPDSHTLELTSEQNLIARLGSDQFKRVSMQGYFVAPSRQLPEPLEKRPPFFRLFSQAWTEMIAMVDGRSPLDVPAADVIERPSGERASRKPRRSLSLTYPQDGAAFVTDSLPLRLPLAWEPAATAQQYEVYFWNQGESLPKARLKTRESFAWVNVERPGQYYARVRSDDGQWISRVHLVVIAKP